jgi:CDP-diacylglycerol pyrophosphatase
MDHKQTIETFKMNAIVQQKLNSKLPIEDLNGVCNSKKTRFSHTFHFWIICSAKPTVDLLQ